MKHSAANQSRPCSAVAASRSACDHPGVRGLFHRARLGGMHGVAGKVVPKLGATEGILGSSLATGRSSASVGAHLLTERPHTSGGRMQKCRLRFEQSAATASAGHPTEHIGGRWGVRVARARDGRDSLFQASSRQLGRDGREAKRKSTVARGMGMGAVGRWMGGRLRTCKGADESVPADLCASGALYSKSCQPSEDVHDQENKHSNLADGAGPGSSQTAVLEIKFKPILIQDILQRRGGRGDDVGRLVLQGNGLQMLPRCFVFFSSLKSLSVTWNELSELPALLGSLPHLQRIDARFNRLLHVASELAHLPQLEELELGDNQLSRLPASFDQRLTSLRRLAVQYNTLEQLPRNLHRIPSLTNLDIRGNPLLPADVQQASPDAAAVFRAIKMAKTAYRSARPPELPRHRADQKVCESILMPC